MKYFKLIPIITIAITLLISCENLDYSEDVSMNQEFVFSEFGTTHAFLTNIYSYLPSDFSSIDGAMRSSASDDAEYVWDPSTVQMFNDGTWSPIYAIDNQWSNMYSGIRACNLLLDELAKNRKFEELRYNDGYDQMMERYALFPYEARFLRAFFYFELSKRYSDIPLITTVLNEQEANGSTKVPYESVVKFIVDECDAISEYLPISYLNIPSNETGKATRGAAYALKARTLLYAASPLHNNSNSNEKWIEAAIAAKKIIDSNLYSLDSYNNFVNNLFSSELIFETRQGASNTFERANFPIGYEGGNTGNCPTQNLVDCYEMKSTGKSIFDSGSGYDPLNPYVGRDPRFAKTILYNGAMFKNESVEIWAGGKNAPPLLNATRTGYYLRKYVVENISLNPVNPSSIVHVWVTFRLGEVLLNYAEAMNEAYGPYSVGPGTLSMTAAEAVNLIRSRAEMPYFPDNLTKEEFRVKLMNERRVELAFEDHRFWDLRRWKIGNTTTNIYGMNIVKNNDGSFLYQNELIEQRVWNDKMYLYPIPQNEVYINSNLTQNNGW